MSEEAPQTGYSRLRALIYGGPFELGALLLRLFYRFRIEGRENVPPDGPYIVWLTEPNLFGMILSGMVSIKVLKEEMLKNSNNNVSYMQEELFRFSFFKKALENPEETASSTANYRPLVPHAAGPLALGLMDGYRVLLNKGIVIINPEGDAPYDGRPLPIGRGLPWLALRTAAPILPILTSVGAYDAWPRWQAFPSRTGRIGIPVGKPFKLCEEPLAVVGPEDMDRANARLRQEFEKRYGPDGLKGWAGPILRNGARVAGPVKLEPPPKPLASVEPVDPGVRAMGRGVAQLLFECPVCRADEALVQTRRFGWPKRVSCQACGTRWELQRVIEHDFRMKVLEGSPDLVGLEMSLTAWYDEMMANFHPKPIDLSGIDLLPDEVVYLEKRDVPLLPYRPNPLFESWSEREPPTRTGGTREYADWASIGEGHLLLTSHRLRWRGPERELDFMWSTVNAISAYMMNILAVRYGGAMYRFNLGNALLLKWLKYAAYAAKAVAQADGHELSISYE
jgi:1-acyl-sn-glycerol-3-phosphate acyltransferase